MAIKQLPSEGWPGGQRPSSGAPLPESLTPGGSSDSAGFPWEGRTFDHHGTAFSDDDGTTPEEYRTAVERIRKSVAALQGIDSSRRYTEFLQDLALAHADAVGVCGRIRLLVPLVAEAGDYGLTPEGRVVEKSQELSIVTVAGPDGRKVLPVFTSAATMQSWNPLARPIPVPGGQVAIAAAQEETDLVIVDPGTDELEFGIRRTALEAFALGKEHLPAWANSAVGEAFSAVCESRGLVEQVMLAPGDAHARLLSPEVTAGIKLKSGLNQDQVRSVVADLREAFSSDETIAQMVDSLAIQLLG